ncbi:SDR family oxidoreductase [Rhizobium leguminosarum]|uniref:SDR family oxidoreductase n=1 Tax=Rhizobium leguminosarum TaxID=384 RepID=UPI001FE1A725|nr:SDR family oxidoreductase [Rhizobium leguminosarum]
MLSKLTPKRPLCGHRAAVVSLTKYFAQECAKDQIFVNSVAPSVLRPLDFRNAGAEGRMANDADSEAPVSPFQGTEARLRRST